MARIVNIIFFPGNFFFSCSKLFNQFPEVPKYCSSCCH